MPIFTSDMSRRSLLILRWTLGGILFGTLFPLIGWWLAGAGFSMASVSAAHVSQSVLWIVDLAPFVLGAAGTLIGIEYANVDAAWRATDDEVQERTADLREANTRLEDLMRSKDLFVATVSHEVRNPLTVVLGFADELRDALCQAGERESAELAELIGDQSREINNIIEDLLVAARTEVGSMTVVPSVIDLGLEVRTVVRGCVCAKDVRDSILLDLEAAPVWADPSRVRQIIRNLLTNAIRYGGDSIKVVVRLAEDLATVFVCDDGPGIRADEREAIFEAYQQGHTDTPVSGSAGLGLSVSRQLARLMGGDLTYRREDGLSMFALTLPSAEAAEDGARVTEDILAV
jgi:signal transduction histidine kinase